MTVNPHECLFLRTWYSVFGCEHPLTEEGQAAIVRLLKARYSHGFHEDRLDGRVLEAYISSTARRARSARVAAEAKKVKRLAAAPSVGAFLAKLKQMKDLSLTTKVTR